MADRAIFPILLGKIIHKGTFGNVYVAKDSNTDICAVKTINIDAIPPQQPLRPILRTAEEEVQNSKTFNCDALLKMITIHMTDKILYIVMPLMAHESTSKIIEKYYPYGMPEAAITMIIRDVLKGVRYMHEHFYIHRAIKGSHILINEVGAAVLTGFDHTLQMDPSATRAPRFKDLDKMTNHLNWLSPEFLVASNVYSYSTDVYSIGITAIELANGVVPYADEEATSMTAKKISELRPELWDNTFMLFQGPNLPPKVPRAPVVWTGSRYRLGQPSSSTSPGTDNATGVNYEEMMNEIYNEKVFSLEFQHFLDLTLKTNPFLRVSVESAQMTKFIKKYEKCLTTDLLHCLQLCDPVEYDEGDEGEELVLFSGPGVPVPRAGSLEPPVEVLYAPGLEGNWRAPSDSSINE